MHHELRVYSGTSVIAIESGHTSTARLVRASACQIARPTVPAMLQTGIPLYHARYVRERFAWRCASRSRRYVLGARWAEEDLRISLTNREVLGTGGAMRTRRTSLDPGADCRRRKKRWQRRCHPSYCIVGRSGCLEHPSHTIIRQPDSLDCLASRAVLG